MGFTLAGCTPKTGGAAAAARSRSRLSDGARVGMNLLDREVRVSSPPGRAVLVLVGPRCSFTMLPNLNYRCVSCRTWRRRKAGMIPGATDWLMRALVIGSTTGGMGAPKTVPFSDRATAERKLCREGGRAWPFRRGSRDYVLVPSECGREVRYTERRGLRPYFAREEG